MQYWGPIFPAYYWGYTYWGTLDINPVVIPRYVTGEIGQQFITGEISEQYIIGEIGEQFITGEVDRTMQHTNGNYFDRTFGPFSKQDGTLLTEISTASSVIFAIKENKTDDDDDALVYADLSAGITVNGTAATIRVVVSGDDMVFTMTDDEQSYYIGIQAVIGGEPVELRLTENGRRVETITIKQDIVRGGA